MNRVCLLSYHFSETTIPLARYLAQAGISVYVYYIKDFSSSSEHPGLDLTGSALRPGLNSIPLQRVKPLSQYFGESDITFNVFVLPPLAKKFPWLSKFALRVLARNVRSMKFDTFHVIGHEPSLIQLIMSLPQERTVVTFHEVCDHAAPQPRLFPLVDFCLRRNISLIVHSRYISDLILRLGGGGRIWIIPFGPFETYRYWTTQEEVKDEGGVAPFLFLGNLLPYKGLDVLADSLRLLKARGVEIPCVIAGNGASELLSGFADLSGVQVIRKRLTNWELVEQIRRCRAVVCPYKSASQSGVVMAAFQFGRPVIASNLAGLAEAIVHGKTGLLVDPCNSAMLATAIDSLYGDNALYSMLQRNVDAIAKTSSRMWAQIATDTISVYESLDRCSDEPTV